MLKINKFTDYALLLLCELKEDERISAIKLSSQTHIPLASTNKILKILLKNNICVSKWGKGGGFTLIKPHNSITILDVVTLIEGTPPKLTQCSTDNSCQMQKHCKISKKMQFIDKEINAILASRTIADLIN